MSAEESNVVELATVEGPLPNTATRLSTVDDEDGRGVLLEQLAYSSVLGWYTQKTFRLPASALPALATQMRMADALLKSNAPVQGDHPATPGGDAIPFPGPALPRDGAPQRRRRDA